MANFLTASSASTDTVTARRNLTGAPGRLITPSKQAQPACPIWKRCLDIGLLLLGLPVVLPVMLVVALMIKLLSKGPIFFKQERIGYLGKPFTCWKFRTMRLNADQGMHRE